MAWPTSSSCPRRERSSARPPPATSIWLDPERTSPYAFYQYWLNVDDRDVGTYLRWFTLLSRAEIEALEAELRGASGGSVPRNGRWPGTHRSDPRGRRRRATRSS